MTDVLVLGYHAVSERWPASLSVTPGALRDQLGHLVARGYRGVTFTEAVCGRAGGRVLAVTFDDAYRSVLSHAAPVLERLGLPATVFVPTAFPDGGGPMSWPGIDRWLGTEHDGELAGLTWSELAELSRGGWEIGSHTHTHPHLTELSDAAITVELRTSKESCEQRLGVPCRSVAYPYGAVDDRVAGLAGEAGYVAGAAPQGARGRPVPLRWPRVGVYHKDSLRRFRVKASAAGRRLRGGPAWTLLEMARDRAPR